MRGTRFGVALVCAAAALTLGADSRSAGPPPLLGEPTDFVTDSSPGGVAIGDLDGDGRPDLATNGFDGDSLCILFNKGDGGFRPVRCDVATPGVPRFLAVADLNGDRRLDLAATVFDAAVAVHLNRGGR